MSPPATAAAPDALQTLLADHREVEALLRRYAALDDAHASNDDRMQLAGRIGIALSVHMLVEEEILYPAARQALPGCQDLVDEAMVEHAGVRALIEQLKAMGADEPMYDARLKVLGEYVAHHVREEESELFPRLRASALDLAALGTRIQERRAQWLAGSAPQGA